MALKLLKLDSAIPLTLIVNKVALFLLNGHTLGLLSTYLDSIARQGLIKRERPTVKAKRSSPHNPLPSFFFSHS